MTVSMRKIQAGRGYDYLLKSVVSGAAGGSPRLFRTAAGRLFFVADDPAHGAELWSSDGFVTAADVLDALDHELAYTTVNTILVRLANKGLVERKREGRS